MFACSYLWVGVSEEAARAPVHHGAAVNIQHEYGYSPLHYAAQCSPADLVDFLWRSGTDETMVNDKEGRNIPMHRRCALLANAPVDRVWRRRGLLVLCIARHHRDHPLSAEIVNTQETNSDDGWTLTAGWFAGRGGSRNPAYSGRS